MSFKPEFFVCHTFSFFRRVLPSVPVWLICLLVILPGFQKTVDRIVAVVNEDVITLTDLKIVRAFGLLGEEESSGLPLSQILQRLIDQKLVVQLSAEKEGVDNQALDAYQKRLRERMGEQKIEEAFTDLGLDWDGLREYIREKLLFDSLISRKFGQGFVVSLDEIEEYYGNTYVPSQREKGLEPKPMIEMLREIESSIKENRVKDQIREWISSLRKQADIQIRVEDSEKYLLQ